MGSASQNQLATAQTELKAASLRADALRQSYLASSQNQTWLRRPADHRPGGGATSDRGRIMQILLFIAVVAGIVVGTALALIRGHREARAPAGP